MKVAVAGAFGHLGYDVLKQAINKNYEVVALDLNEKDVPEKGKYIFHKIDVTNKETLKGTLEGVDVIVSTVGLVSKSAKLTNYDIDLNGNLNLLEEAKASGVKKFIYVSVIHAETAPDVPMLDAKAKFEEKLKASGLVYSIVRPTGYFYDIVKVFRPMIEKGTVNLLGKKDHACNVIDTPEFGEFIVAHMLDENKTYSIGGKETWTYRQIAEMCFAAAGKEPNIKCAPTWLFSVLASLPKNKKNGKAAIIKFSKFTLSNDLVGDTIAGERSFKEYINECFHKE